MRDSVSQNDIADGLREVGLEPGDTVFMHSSLSSFGHVEGGAEAVARAFLEVLGQEGSVHVSKWPEVDDSKLNEEKVEIPIQINGKVRGKIEVAADAGEDEVQKLALEHENVAKSLDGNEPQKIIYVPGRIITIVVN